MNGKVSNCGGSGGCGRKGGCRGEEYGRCGGELSLGMHTIVCMDRDS